MRKDARKTAGLGLAAAALVAGLTACGSDTKKDPTTDPTTPTPTPTTVTNPAPPLTDPNAVGAGFVTKGADNVVTLDFSKATAGSKYVLMPYVLGDPGTVSGSLKSTTQLSFTVATATGGPANLVPLPSPRPAAGPAFLADGTPAAAVDTFAAALARDHAKRTLLNRFDPALGLDQDEGFWEMARSLDQQAPDGVGEGLEERYHQEAVAGFALAERASVHQPLALDAGGCPTTKVDVPLGTKDTDSDTIPTAPVATGLTSNVIDGGNFCLVFLSPPKTEPDVNAIQASIKTILDTYSKVIYKDTWPAVGSFNFKPTYVVVDVADSNLWQKKTENPALNLAGAFIGYVAQKNNLPLIYMAADFTQVDSFGTGVDAGLLKKQFHSVLAHETQHAILNYYRVVGGGVGETISVDEGLAHFMEDLFGYGKDAFQFWAKPFLDGVTDGTIPFLYGSADYTAQEASKARSSAHTLLYYLASQAGGVVFANGQPSTSAGLDFIVNVVKDKSAQGPATLAKQLAKLTASGTLPAPTDWTTTVGNYLGALILDNVTALGTAATAPYSLVPVQSGVKDLTGDSTQTYGLRFNNFGGVADHLADVDTNAATVGTISGLSFYLTKPVVYTVADPTQKLKFTLSTSGVPNVAVSAVRIK